MDDAFLQIQNVSKTFAGSTTPALHDLNLSFSQGKIIGVAGPDGSGKTTLLRMLAGLLVPSKGKITVAGLNTATEAEKIHEILGYMPQKFGLYEDLSVMHNLNLYAELKKIPPNERGEIFKTLLTFTNLHRFTDRLAGNLSGGMKQKLGLACALMGMPKILVLDEPSVGVDPVSRQELWKMVLHLIQDNILVIWSTSYLNEVEKCNEVVLLNEGEVFFSGEPKDLTKRAEGRVFRIGNFDLSKRKALEKILENENVVDGVIEGKDLRILLKKESDPSWNLSHIPLGNEVSIRPDAPRFEDVFVEMLGGNPKAKSPLVEIFSPASASNESPVKAENLTKKFGSFTAVNNVSFEIKKGEIFGLLGPNGAGKSTIFKMMCGLLTPTSGASFINGIPLIETPSLARAHLGYMAQKFSLYGDLSVLQNLRFFSGIYNLQGSERSRIIEKMVNVFALKPYLDTNSNLLPLGFKQRLALSCAVMHNPDILFLDEPTSGVDPITRREFWKHISALVEKGVTIVISTHFMDEAEYCDRIGLVYQSKLIQMGDSDTLKKIVQTEKNPSPTLEDAFIELIERYDKDNHNG